MTPDRDWPPGTEPMDARELAVKRRFRKPTPPFARCEQCGSDQLSPLPMFSTGCGQGFRPVADDFRCLRCGHIGPFTMDGQIG